MKKAFLDHSCLLNSSYCEQRKNKIKYLNIDSYFFKKIGILLSPSYERNNWKFDFFCDPRPRKILLYICIYWQVCCPSKVLTLVNLPQFSISFIRDNSIFFK